MSGNNAETKQCSYEDCVQNVEWNPYYCYRCIDIAEIDATEVELSMAIENEDHVDENRARGVLQFFRHKQTSYD